MTLIFYLRSRELPSSDPEIKLTPRMKLKGSAMVSSTIKSILCFWELFCIPSIKNKNKNKFTLMTKNNFLRFNFILVS